LLEYNLVLDSWLKAIAVANDNGMQAQLVPVLLHGDTTSIPEHVYRRHTPTAKPTIVHEYLDTGPLLKNARLPSVGEILDAGINATDADVIVLTNRDIAMYPSFYLDACRDLSRPDTLAVERTRVAIPLAALNANTTHAMYHRKLHDHPGADCFILPRRVIPRCLRRNRMLVVGLPPWGLTFRA